MLKKVLYLPNSLINMQSTFDNCSNLIEVPSIPIGVENMYLTFVNCTSLLVAPSIPNTVTKMEKAFQNCTKLQTAPAIPDSVNDLRWCFQNCNELRGNIEINANVNGTIISDETGNNVDYWKCLDAATTSDGLSLKVTGSCQVLDEIVANANNSRITL